MRTFDISNLLFSVGHARLVLAPHVYSQNRLCIVFHFIFNFPCVNFNNYELPWYDL